MTTQGLIPAALAVLLCLAHASVAGEPTPRPTAADLDKAVAAMRKVKPADFEDEEKRKAKGRELSDAWKTLIGAGPGGATRLKTEIAAITKAKERDDYFKLGAAAVLWQIGKLNEAKTIAAAWLGDVDLALNYNYVFYTAFEAAMTQDARALPLLTAVLRDDKGSIFLAVHMLQVKWPLTHEFLWGAFGSKGLPALARVLAESKDETAQASALRLLAKAHYLPVLQEVRRLAHEGQGAAHGEAVKALGEFGHPQDYDFLVGGLKTTDPKEAWYFVYALYEYADLRAVPHLVRLLGAEDEALRNEATACLTHLDCPAALEAMQKYSTPPPGATEDQKKMAAEYAKYVQQYLTEMNLTWDAYAAKPAAERAAAMATLRGRADGKYVLKAGDRRLTHDELLKAAAEWMKKGRIRGGAYKWVKDRHVLAAATAADIPLLLDVKAKCYRRLSDECLYQTRTLDRLIRRLGRSRYRKVVGVCEKVEAP